MRPRRKFKPKAKRGVIKNKFEGRLLKLLESQWGEGKVEYETDTLKYRIDEERKYTPDFKLKDSKLYVEGKGKFTFEDRKKMLLVKEQHPELTIHMFFVSADKPLYKGSKTSYGDWCTKNGIVWSDEKRGLPKDWR